MARTLTILSRRFSKRVPRALQEKQWKRTLVRQGVPSDQRRVIGRSDTEGMKWQRLSGGLMELVKQTSLSKIKSADAPMKLSGKGGLFATSSSGANKEAISRLKDESQPLVVENGSGKTLTVALTPAGFDRIADVIPEEKLITAVSGPGR